MSHPAAIIIDGTTPGPVDAAQLALIIGDTLTEARASWLPMPQAVTASTASAAAELAFDGHDGQHAWKAIGTWCRAHGTRPATALRTTPEHGRHTLLHATFTRKGITIQLTARIPAPAASDGTPDPAQPPGSAHPADGNPAVVISE